MSSPSSRPRISGPLGEGRKRKRTPLSCFDCRRRKLKCDREYPSCSRCRKAGLASSCSYDERPRSPKQSTATPVAPLAPSDWSSTSPTTHPVARVRQGNRIEIGPSTLETSQTSGTWQLTAFSGERPYVKAALGPAPHEAIIFRGNNFKTQYYGGSNPTSIIAHFPELRLFMKEAIMHHSSLPRVQRDLKALEVRWKVVKTDVLPLTDLELLRLLPDRETVDYLVRLYFDTFETMYRILHRPSFWIEYQMFWENRGQAANPAIVILLLLMMAAVSCLSLKEQPTYIGSSAIARERAVLWIEVSEWWLRRHSQKHIYLAIWQMRCLLILAKQVNVVKKKQSWTAAGTLVREAMSAGFHRDPSLLGEKVSIFDQEMRRRLWATMVELELQASIDRGMPSASAGIPSDCATLLNVNDEDLTVECDTLPLSKPWGVYTACSFLHISRASFSLRVSLNSIANDLSSPLQYNEVLDYGEIINKELEKLPPPDEPRETQDTRGLPAMVRTLLDVQLRQFLILLHAPFAREAGTNVRFLLSMMICFNAAASMIEQHSQLTRSSNFLLLLLRQDCLRAALVICHNMSISISVQNNLFFGWNSNTFIQYVENALTMLGDRISRLGTGHTHFWYISSACSLIRSTVLSQDSTALKQQAIDRLARQYYQVLASQEDFIKAKEIVIPVHDSKTNAVGDQLQISDNMMTAPGVAFPDASASQSAFEQTDLPLEEFYFGDPAAWTFDNLWEIE